MVAANPYVPAIGDLVWIDFDPQAGSEQAGRRPAIVISGATYNRRTGLGVFCPITNRTKGYPFEVALPLGLPVTGVILCDQIKCMDWRARRVEWAGKASKETIAAVHEKLDILMDRE